MPTDHPPPVRLIAVPASGKRTVLAHFAFTDRPHGWEQVEVDAFPASVERERLRAELIAAPDLREDLARALGLAPGDLSTLTRGRATLCPEDWHRVFAALTSLRGG